MWPTHHFCWLPFLYIYSSCYLGVSLELHFVNYSFLILNTFLSPIPSFFRLCKSLYNKKSQPFLLLKILLISVSFYNLNSKNILLFQHPFPHHKLLTGSLESNTCSLHFTEITSWAYTWSITNTFLNILIVYNRSHFSLCYWFFKFWLRL